MLMGAYIFLGSEALIPQLTANVSAVGSAVTMIRSRSILVNRGWIKKCQVTISPVLVEFIVFPACDHPWSHKLLGILQCSQPFDNV